MSISRNAAYNLAGSIVPVGLALITVPMYISEIGAERYGILSIAFLFLGYFGIFDLGLGRSTTYKLAEIDQSLRERRLNVLWTAVLLNVCVGFVGGLVAWGTALFFFENAFKTAASLQAEVISALPLIGLCLPVATLTGVLAGALQADRRFVETNVISVTSTALFQVLPLMTAKLAGPNLVLLIAAGLVARIVAIALLSARCYAVFRTGHAPRFQRHEVRNLLSFGGWVAADGVLAPLVSMIDRFAIGAFIGDVAVTTYTIPFQLAQRLTIFPSALLNAAFPHLPTAGPDERRSIARVSLQILLCALTAPVVMGIFLVGPFFHVWLGEPLARQAAIPGMIIIAGFWFNSLAWAPYVWLQGTGRPDLVTKIHLLEVPGYLIILCAGLLTAGVTGAALALLLRNMADLALLCLASHQRQSLKRVFCFSLPVGLSLICGLVYTPTNAAWWVALIAASSVSLGLSWISLPIEVKHKIKLPRPVGAER